MQEQLIEWEIAHRIYTKNPEDMGRVGPGYSFNFMKRKKHLIKSKSGKRYLLDRSNFTTYLNFRDLYNHIEDVLVNDSRVASRLPKPMWRNAKGEKVCKQSDAVGYKVNIEIHRKNICIVPDKVGCNLTQEKVGSKGG